MRGLDRRGLRRAARGQAVVELAVAMLIIVPTFLYVLFLDDLLRAKLDLEEAVVTAPWEYARVNYEQGAAGTGLRSAIRLGWCDHTTAYNSYDRGYECGPIHHVALSAHTCWLTNGAKQVSCSVDNSVGQLLPPVGIGVPIANSQFTRGGLVRCSARLGVMNYSLPQKLFQEFSQVDMTRATKHSGNDVHGDGQGLAVESHYLLEEQQAGLVVDSWALADPMRRIDSLGSGTLRSRTNAIYMPYAIIAAALGGLNFATKVLQSDIINASIFLDYLGDNPVDANVAFDPDFENGVFNGNFHASPTGPKRGDKYMGQSTAP